MRQFDCRHYNDCLMAAAKKGKLDLECDGCKRFLPVDVETDESLSDLVAGKRRSGMAEDEGAKDRLPEMCNKCGVRPAGVTKDGRVTPCRECRAKAISKGHRRNMELLSGKTVSKGRRRKNKELPPPLAASEEEEVSHVEDLPGFSWEAFREHLKEHGLVDRLKVAAEYELRSIEAQAAWYIMKGLDDDKAA